MAEGDFSSETREELRKLLGSKLDDALWWLQAAAAFYVTAKALNVSAKTRREIERIVDVLAEVERATKQLSPGAVALLGELNEVMATNRVEPFITVDRSLAELASSCTRVREAASVACGKVGSPGMVLAAGVARVLAGASLPISKGRDGLFTRVLATIWHEVDSAGVPEDLNRYVRGAADQVLRHHPTLRPRKGRPLVPRIRTPRVGK